MEAVIGPLTFAVLNGAVWGLVLSLVSLGLSLIFSNMRWLNFAHAAFYMLGGMLAWRLQLAFSFWGALLITPLSIGALGVGLERVLLRNTRDLPQILVITIGLMLLIQGLAIDLFGATPRSVELPIEGRLEIFNRQMSLYRLFVGALSLVTITAIWSFLKYTRFGLWIRAVGKDRELALMQGVPVPLVLSMTFGIGVGLAGLAGVLIAPFIGVHPLMGLEILILALIIVIAGRGPWGAVGIAMTVSVLENLLPTLSQFVLGELMSPTLIRASLLGLLVIWLILRSLAKRESSA